jgi:hypothetical protein
MLHFIDLMTNKTISTSQSSKIPPDTSVICIFDEDSEGEKYYRVSRKQYIYYSDDVLIKIYLYRYEH